MTNQGEPRVVSLGGKQYSGKPPAMTGEWRVESKHSLRYAKVHTDHDAFVLDYMPRELAEQIVADHNAASRLRIAEEYEKLVDEVRIAGARHSKEWWLHWLNRADALKGASHE